MITNFKTVNEIRKGLETTQNIEAESSYIESLREKISEAEKTDESY